MDSASQKLSYRRDIDGLRAIAVLVVLFYHAQFFGFSGGFVGVDVFFVISGYLITQFLYHQVSNGHKINFLDFYAKRIRRLFPGILLVVFTSIILWAIFLSGIPLETKNFIRSIRYSVFGMANIFFKNNTGGYFDGTSDEFPLLHFWSLGVEEQFYLIWPLIILFSGKKLPYFLTAIILISFSWTVYLLNNQEINQAFYLMPARAWELGLGGLLVFIIPLSKSRITKTASNILSLLGLFLISLPVYLYDHTVLFPGMAAIPPVLGTMLIILCGSSKEESVFYKLLGSKWLVQIGLLSYGLYLWHWPFLAMLKIYHLGEVPPLSLRVLSLALSLIIAKFTYDFVEEPIRHKKILGNLRPLYIMGLGLGMAALLVLSANGLKLLDSLNLKDVTNLQKQAEFKTDLNICSKTEDVGTFKCYSDFSSSPKTSRQLWLWGNSHSESYLPMLKKVAEDHKIKINAYTQWNGNIGLLYPDDLIINNKEKLTTEGRIYNQKIMNEMESEIKKGNQVSVLLASRLLLYGGNPIPIKDKGKFYLDKEQTQAGSRAI